MNLKNTSLIEKQIGEIAKARREDLRQSASFTAKTMNGRYHFKWTERTVYQIEAGRRSLTIVEAFALAAVLKISVYQLAGLAPIQD